MAFPQAPPRSTEMIEKNIRIILLVTGSITMLPVIQFFAPELMLQQQGLSVSDDAGMLFARHWGLVVFCVGALLAYAATNTPARRPIVLAGLIQKLGLVSLVVMHWSNPALQGLHAVAVFDAICVVLYAVYLLGNGKHIDAKAD
jgi:cytochrome c oxidase subunit IV